ncbi:AtpZ/AtpI family protein [Seonamhaeicola aphaedonensis]|uniref:Putative F0F1-ATPase subunit (Ca2+/Mg2+ transporter) n=1 Tax=Seonamhaeicola aphaedonensis TaxID=1461338 RepID=A0A3D9HH90_9FLAO|nr:AtpZ/AtpI family protein [Seonamhaeicola aphaedonensis]RED48912.1 putative F0F1-ATPase subunit (Ca2+/Mg2+ transporter) [Seonamhaeicola aphaedonensis]
MADNENQKPKKQLKNAAVLTGVAIQMGVTIYLFVLLGKWLDTKYNHGEKLFIIITTLAGVAISLYAVVKQLNRLNND